MSSFTRLEIYVDGKQKIVAGDIAPTRYLIGQAHRDCVKEMSLGETGKKEFSPKMANVSLIVPVKIDGEYYLLSQIKGKAMGSGEIHTGLVAGNVDGKYLFDKNPLVSALQSECSEELGMDLSTLNSTSFLYIMDEVELGGISFVSIAKNTNIDQILEHYEKDTKQKLQESKLLEVNGLTILPIAGIALVPLEDGSAGLKNSRCYIASANGLQKTIEDRRVRPATSATIDFLQEEKNIKSLLERAGF